MQRSSLTGERSMAVFLLGALAFSPPLLAIFTGGLVFGIPLLYLYLFIAWGGVILLCALAGGGADGGAGGGPRGG